MQQNLWTQSWARSPFFFASVGILNDHSNRRVHLGHYVILQLLAASGETPRLAHLPAHAIAERGVEGKLSSWGSAMPIRLSAIKEAGRSGLSSAARPTLAQNPT